MRITARPLEHESDRCRHEAKGTEEVATPRAARALPQPGKTLGRPTRARCTTSRRSRTDDARPVPSGRRGSRRSGLLAGPGTSAMPGSSSLSRGLLSSDSPLRLPGRSNGARRRAPSSMLWVRTQWPRLGKLLLAPSPFWDEGNVAPGRELSLGPAARSRSVLRAGLFFLVEAKGAGLTVRDPAPPGAQGRCRLVSPASLQTLRSVCG